MDHFSNLVELVCADRQNSTELLCNDLYPSVYRFAHSLENRAFATSNLFAAFAVSPHSRRRWGRKLGASPFKARSANRTVAIQAS